MRQGPHSTLSIASFRLRIAHAASVIALAAVGVGLSPGFSLRENASGSRGLEITLGGTPADAKRRRSGGHGEGVTTLRLIFQ